jgi:hypothetical protein
MPSSATHVFNLSFAVIQLNVANLVLATDSKGTREWRAAWLEVRSQHAA